jgi:hypothetical protein
MPVKPTIDPANAGRASALLQTALSDRLGTLFLNFLSRILWTSPDNVLTFFSPLAVDDSICVSQIIQTKRIAIQTTRDNSRRLL